MSNYQVAFIEDGICRRWWQLADVNTADYRRLFNQLTTPDAEMFDVRVSHQDGEPLPEGQQILVIEPGSAYRLYGRNEWVPSLNERVE